MIADARFLKQPPAFWADVRTISQAVGYTKRRKGEGRGKGEIRVPTLDDIKAKYKKRGLQFKHILDPTGAPTPLGQKLLDYFSFRA